MYKRQEEKSGRGNDEDRQEHLKETAHRILQHSLSLVSVKGGQTGQRSVWPPFDHRTYGALLLCDDIRPGEVEPGTHKGERHALDLVADAEDGVAVHIGDGRHLVADDPLLGFGKDLLTPGGIGLGVQTVDKGVELRGPLLGPAGVADGGAMACLLYTSDAADE